MKTKINYFAIGLFYIIAISIRYITNKTIFLDEISNGFLKIIVQGAGPAIGACVVFLLFKIQPKLSLQGNYTTISTPILLYCSSLHFSTPSTALSKAFPIIANRSITSRNSSSFPFATQVHSILCILQ